jgi:membrane fusion protein (multidrug efflux system)
MFTMPSLRTIQAKLPEHKKNYQSSINPTMLALRKLILPLALAVLLSGCEEEPAATARGGWGGAARVVAQIVERQHIVDEIEALGTARANESIDIQPRIASLVERIAFEEGQLVQKGDLLVELENSEIVAGLALAEASLSESLSLYNRSKSLADSQAISASNLEQLLAQVRVNQARVEAAKARLANSAIRAPFSGRIGLRRVSPGSFVDTSTIITTLDDISSIKLDFTVPEAFINVLSAGMDIDISAHSLVFPDRVFKGTVTSIDTRLDPVSRAVRVRSRIPNEAGLLKPGMFMSVDLERDLGEVVLAPEQSIVPEGSRQYVFVVTDGVAEQRPVQLGRRIPGYAVVESGLEAGEQVVTEGTHRLRDGVAVEVSASATAAAGPPDRS